MLKDQRLTSIKSINKEDKGSLEHLNKMLQLNIKTVIDQTYPSRLFGRLIAMFTMDIKQAMS